ncbi:flagellar protein FlaG [Paenibacillus sp. SYP-B3998]|uniref:Flagellar protein FlaG n=1 Tax=Paenibacillus sp. SYP-B3998 TaxID=2678564 RepID=A0A6G4A4V5_9BACL|nr:flagellar protein FlaG [Paenibacillus sp. SYP-B3998]NEW08839.1 flagellar protein FlaG [Paenibacillus sp. SYP-B3998]
MDISSIPIVGGSPQSNPNRSSFETDKTEVKEALPLERAEHIPIKEIGRQELERSIEGLNKFMQVSNTHLSFVLHDELKEYYVQVIDDQTKEVIREVPSKKMLDVVAAMKNMIGILIDEKR